MGYLGSLSQDPLGRIFSKCAFLNLLSPLGLPLPSNTLGSSKKLKNFPRGCGVCFACDMSIFFSLGKTLSEQSWSAIFQICCLAIVHRASETYRQTAAICDVADYKEA